MASNLQEVKEALKSYGVIVIKGADLDAAQLVKLGECFGDELFISTFARSSARHSKDFPEIITTGNVELDGTPKPDTSVINWH